MTHRAWSHRSVTLTIGPVSAGLGVAVGHLLAAATSPAASPVLAVGSTAIDHTPTAVKEWAILHFGSNDKTVLIGGVLIVVLLVSVLAGPLARRDPRAGIGLLIALTLVAMACTATRPGATYTDLVPTLATGVVAVTTLMTVLGLEAKGPDDGSRRAILVSGGAAVAALALGQTGRWLTARRTRDATFALPRAADPAGPMPAGLDRTVPGITRLRTSAGNLYRVDTRLDVPIVDTGSWRLVVDGMVRHPFTLGFDDLLALPLIERDVTLTCVSNSVGGPYVGGCRWLGVRLADLLDRAGVEPGADQILSTDVDRMTISTPLDLATDGRDSMVVVGLNGAPLPREHGFPARLLVPGLYGFIGATKWLTRLTLTTYAERDAYWTRRGWATRAPIKISSRIDTPRALAELDAGEVVVGGVAWAQERHGVSKVEVQVDGKAWQQAHLGPPSVTTTGANGSGAGMRRPARTRSPVASRMGRASSRPPRGPSPSRPAPRASTPSRSRWPDRPPIRSPRRHEPRDDNRPTSRSAS